MSKHRPDNAAPSLQICYRLYVGLSGGNVRGTAPPSAVAAGGQNGAFEPTRKQSVHRNVWCYPRRGPSVKISLAYRRVIIPRGLAIS